MNIDHEKLWYSKNLFSTVLLPLSWFFKTAASLRKVYYESRISHELGPRVFTIVIGNITVGGTGKTPFVIWLANYCKAQGLQVGIVTRGYKRASKRELIEVNPQSTADQVGDESVLLAHKTSCPVMVSANRERAVKQLTNKYNLDVVLSDDGLQHYKLPRDIEIAIVDAERRFGNGRSLPAGPLREPIKRLEKCDLVVSNGYMASTEIAFELSMEDAVSLSSHMIRKPLDEFKDFTVHAVAGIGNPERFFNMLRSMDMNVIEHKFPDHYRYKEKDLEFNSSDPILMTEKDAVKCRKFTGKKIWYIPVSLLPSSALQQRISAMIEGIPHG